MDYSKGTPILALRMVAAGRDGFEELHLVAALPGIGLGLRVGNLLVERVATSNPVQAYWISHSEIAMKYEVVSWRLSADDSLVVKALTVS